jgi:hypothetical protein
MKYDNERDRLQYGYDAGNIVDGVVQYDPETKEYVIVDEAGVGFSTQALLKELETKKIRFTCVSFESIENIQKLLASTKTDTN